MSNTPVVRYHRTWSDSYFYGFETVFFNFERPWQELLHPGHTPEQRDRVGRFVHAFRQEDWCEAMSVSKTRCGFAVGDYHLTHRYSYVHGRIRELLKQEMVDVHLVAVD